MKEGQEFEDLDDGGVAAGPESVPAGEAAAERRLAERSILLTKDGVFQGTDNGGKIVDLMVETMPNGDYIAYLDAASAETGQNGRKLGRSKFGESTRLALSEEDYREMAAGEKKKTSWRDLGKSMRDSWKRQN